MENNSMTHSGAAPSPASRTYTAKFRGEGFDLFVTLLVNAILTVLTLGVYAAWGKVKVYKFYYSSTEFANHRFRFTGTGKEIFIGYLKAIGLIIGFVLVYGVLLNIVIRIEPGLSIVMTLGLYLLIIYFLHYAIYSSLRYRFSRTTFREIRFRLDGEASEFARDAFKNFLLSIVTLGVFTPYYLHRKFAFIYNRLHFGNMPFQYNGDEKEFFKIAFSGFLLTLVTLGVYYFWWAPKMYNYYVQHLSVGDGKFRAEIKPGEFFQLVFSNVLIIVFTLGIGFAWVAVRTAAFYVNHVRLEGDLDLDNVVQTEQETVSATGEGLAEALDMGVGFGL